MSWLLHLSDLHLREDEDDDPLSDNKSHVIPDRDLQLRSERMSSTIESIARMVLTDGLDLDCIVITGDVANHNNASGYLLLPKLLAPLVPVLVPAERVVVVPGNHDVAQYSPPSSPARYSHFVRLRDFDYLTPLLEGVDTFDDDYALAPTRAPILVARDRSFVLAAMNSANHSQSPAPEDPSLAMHSAELDNLREAHPAVEALWQAWNKLGQSDPCWVGSGQRRILTQALDQARLQAPDALRIVALHHQLLPASPSAEIKPYETMLNLGEVLEWITENGIDVVLHGHKHVGKVTPVDQATFSFGTNGDKEVRTLVVSAPMGRPDAGAMTPVARLVKVEPVEPRVAGVRVTDVLHVGVGASRRVADLPSQVYVLEPDVERGIVRGATALEVHRKLLSMGDRLHPHGMPLTCHIEHGESALTIPTTYPALPAAVADMQSWFGQTIEWWQAERATSGAPFNHGERIRAFVQNARGGREPLDQLRHAVDALSAKEDSTRAIVVLVDPERDLQDPKGPPFPSFTIAQFGIRNGRLNVIGYFRKQEIPHWWPVNVGELATLQAELIERLASIRPAKPGSITTITANAVRGGNVPRVAIPSLDRHADEPNGLLDLVLPLMGLSTAAPHAVRASWERALTDWDPTDGIPADGDPIPLFGLRALSDLLAHVIGLNRGGTLLGELLSKVEALRASCFEYSRDGQPGRGIRARWVATWQASTAEILALVDKVLTEQDPQFGSGGA